MRRCPMCKAQSQGPGCCEASLKAELWRLHSLRDGLKAAFGRRQTPELQKRLLENTEDIADVRLALGAFTLPTQERDDAQEPPRLSGGHQSA